MAFTCLHRLDAMEDTSLVEAIASQPSDVAKQICLYAMLEALQPHFSDIPILVMYPGEFDGHYLKLFGRLAPNDYYRAFNIF